MNSASCFFLGIGLLWNATAAVVPEPLAWPPLTRQSRPWAYNWWHGSAVDPTNLVHELKRYRDGGLGGIHIIPIYGVKGAESRDVEFLSPAWMELLRAAVSEGARLDLGVDLTTGTGWCFGGPNVPKEQGGWRLQIKTFDVAAGGGLPERFDPRSVQALRAVGADGTVVDLAPRLDGSGQARWDTAGQAWRVHAVWASPGGPAVKRASPGGTGPMLNPIHPAAMSNYLARFTEVFGRTPGPQPRAMYHDSYEYNTTWSPDFLADFARHRRYRLEDHWAAFWGDPTADDVAARVRADYRETVADLMVEDVFPQWVRWSAQRGFLTRNQAHGAPANLLDFYALVDVPETEMFGRGDRDPLRSGFDARFGEGDRNPLISKFAASAAHLTGRPLVAAETGTWMAEHFCETLEELKCLVDLLFVSGVNHVIYHGCCYSPDDAAWPGWLFYASTEMNPRNPIWRDVPALNLYVARAQAVLQSGQPDNELLVYWPIHDLWHRAPGLLTPCTVHNHSWLTEQPLGRAASMLWARGYGFDYVSDRLLSPGQVTDGRRIRLPGGDYSAVVVPECQRMPVPTLQKLLDLAAEGATVVFEERLPDDVPGLAALESRRAELQRLRAKVRLAGAGVREASVGRGRVLVGPLEPALEQAGLRRERIVDHPGVRFIRRTHPAGRHYFIANQGTEPLSGWQPIATPCASAVLLDPLSGQTGVAAVRRAGDGTSQVWLRLDPGHSVLLRTFEQRTVRGPEFPSGAADEATIPVTGPWQVRFVAGGPELPRDFQTEVLGSWTTNGDARTEGFAGTAVYATSFDAPRGSGSWWLDLGRVCHSAKVRLNGVDLGTLIMPPYRVRLESLQPRSNRLEVEVTNLGANRIRDLDRRKVPWKIFHDINLVNLRYRPFDASDWPVLESGLLGPVALRSGVAQAPR